MKKRKVIKAVSFLTAIGISLNCFSNWLFRWGYKKNLIDNAYTYCDELVLYNDFINNYAEYINSLGLNDLEIFLKIIKDQWADIDGYGKAENLIGGYYRLTFQEEGKGVCTSFSDDFTAKINAINPKYNARNLIVYMDEINVDKDIVNIDRNILSNSTQSDKNLFRKIYGNHMVSVVEIPEQNLTLVVDPTNLFIGKYVNGKIKIFNVDEDFIDVRYNFSSHYTTKSYLELFNEYLSTYREISTGGEDVANLYGVNAQKEAFSNIEEIDQQVKRKVFLRDK